MKIFITILLTAIITLTIGTQFNIEWPRILIVKPSFPDNQYEDKTFNVTPNSAPISAPPQPSAPSPPRILPKIPSTGEVVITPIGQIEREVVRLVNEIRIERGTSALIWDDRLHNLARMHSLDMANRGNLFHSPPDAEYAENAWGGPGGIDYSALEIVEAWLSSEYHRTWLLCPNLEHIAVGIYIKDDAVYAAWTFWRNEPKSFDWWYPDDEPPDWWY